MMPIRRISQSAYTILFTAGYYMLFGIVIFIILYHFYDPELLYFKLQPFFAFDSSYLSFFQVQHHGVLIIISSFFLQFLYYPVIGTLLLTVLLLAFAFVLKKIIHYKEPGYLNGIEFIPSLYILISLKNYTLGIEVLILFLVVEIFLLINRYLLQKHIVFKFIFQLLSVILTYFLFGPSVSFAFLIVLLASELIFNRNILSLTSVLTGCVMFIFLIYFELGLALVKPILETLNPSNIRAIIPQFWPVFGLILLTMLCIFFLSLFKNKRTFFNKLPEILTHSVSIILLLAIIAIFGKRLFINPFRYNTEIEYHAYSKDWNQVLKLKHKVTLEDRISIFHLNRALYHTGQMQDKLFSMRQHWGINTLFLTMQFNRSCTINSSDLFFDMGFIKGSEYWALEAQTHNPYSPRILMRLASTSALLGDTLTAKKYLTVLSQSRIYRKWAVELHQKIVQEGIVKLREEWFGDLAVENDIFYINNKNPNFDLIQILRKDPNNKMAFEYLLSYYLLCNEFGNFYHYLKLYGNYHVKDLSEIYQQAIIFYQMATNIPFDQIGFSISDKVKNDMKNFSKILFEYKMDIRKAQKDLYKHFGSTYWYYIRYNSPVTVGTNINRKNL